MTTSKERCDGCGGMFTAPEMHPGEENTRWCVGCIHEAAGIMAAPRLARDMRLAPEHRQSPSLRPHPGRRRRAMSNNQAIKAFPLQWPPGWKRTKYRKSSTYRVTTDAAITHLLGALRLMGASDIVISSNVPTRSDGQMYRGDHTEKRLVDPGVAVYWTIRDARGDRVPRALALDPWHTVRENVHALGIAIDCFRALKRCGADEIQERSMQGFALLPETVAERFDPWEVLGLPQNATAQQIKDRFRELARTEHPDQGGSTATFARITRAHTEALRSIGG